MTFDVLRSEPTAAPITVDPILDHGHGGRDLDDHDTLSADSAADPNAMLPYVDDDHDDHDRTPRKKKKPRKKRPRSAAKAANGIAKNLAHHTLAPKGGAPLDAATQALLDKALAASADLLATSQRLLAAETERKRAAESKDQLRKKINDAKALAYGVELAMYSRDMGDATSKAFIQRLDSIDDADLREKVRVQFQQQTGQTLEKFITNCDDWNNNGDKRDKHAALQLIDKSRDGVSEQIRTMDPDVRAMKEKAANAAAIEILSGTTAHDHSDANQQKIFRALQGRDPVEIEMIRTAMREHTNGKSNLYRAIDGGMHEGNEDEAVAMLAGNRVDSARAVFNNETDPARLREVIKQLSADEREEVSGLSTQLMLARVKNPADRAELEALLGGNAAKADAERLGNLLKPREEGFTAKLSINPADLEATKVGKENYDRREAGSVIKEFESMSGAEVKAAAEAWDQAHPGRPFRQMIEARWTGDSNSDEKARLLAMIDGDKGKARSIRLQEAMRSGNQKEIEGALAHDTVTEKELTSEDETVRKRALAIKAENDSFERNNLESNAAQQRVGIFLGTNEDDLDSNDPTKVVGKSTADQLAGHYDRREKKDVGQSADEKQLRAFGQTEAADKLHAERQAKHAEKTGHEEIASGELLVDGKLSKATEVFRGKGAKEKADLVDNITTSKELEEAKDDYRKKYNKEMFATPTKERADMNANELVIDNVRLYGVRPDRPAQVEYLLQSQMYKKQYSAALEADEREDGGGSQEWQRQELANMREALKDPKIAIGETSRLGGDLPMMFNAYVENANDPSFAEIEAKLPQKGSVDAATGEKLDDGLKDDVSKAKFNQYDKGMTSANAVQADAKKRLADRIIKVFSTIAKIAALLTANPALIMLIDLGEGLLEMAIKAQVMGEAYDPALDAKMLAFTVMADGAMLGFSKLGKAAGAAMTIERQAMHMIEGKVAKTAFSEGSHAAIETAKAVAKKEATYNLAGGAAKLGISTIGGGIVQDKSAGEIAQSLGAGAVGLVLPGYLSGKAKAAFGTGSIAQKVLGEVAETTTDIATNTVIGVAGGAEAGDAALDATLGHGGQRFQAGYASVRKRFADAPDAAKPTHAVDENYQPIHAEDHATTKPVDDHAMTRAQPLDENYAPLKSHGETRAGASDPAAPIGGGASETHHRTVAHAENVSERAALRRHEMDPDTRKLHDHQFALAENPAQQAILERAIASGRAVDDIATLRRAMTGMSEVEVLREFSGAGLFQMYHQSCVPTAYQIALADVDPTYALHLRNNPDEMMQIQRDVLIDGGAAQTERKDGNNQGAHIKGQLANPEIAAIVTDASRYSQSGNQGGIDVTVMAEQKLHKQLEKATGSTYEIVTRQAGASKIENVPLDRIAQAAASSKPVLFSMMNHEYALVGQHVGPDGQVSFKYHDPMSGTTALIAAEAFAQLPIQSLTLPGAAQDPTMAPVIAGGGGGSDDSDTSEPITRPVVKGPPPTIVPVPPSEQRQQADLTLKAETELARRGIAPGEFLYSHPGTASKIDQALRDDNLPGAKTLDSDSAAVRAQEWALERGRRSPEELSYTPTAPASAAEKVEPKEFAYAYEYARAEYAREKNKNPKPANPSEVIQRDILDPAYEHDLGVARKLGAGDSLAPHAPGMSDAELVEQVRDLQRIQYESPAAEVYHANKHGHEVPTSLAAGGNERVERFNDAGMTVVANPDFVFPEKKADGTQMLKMVKNLGDAKEPVWYEVLVAAKPDGTMRMVSAGKARSKTAKMIGMAQSDHAASKDPE